MASHATPSHSHAQQGTDNDTISEGHSLSPPAFQLKASPANPGGGSGAIQRNIMDLHGTTARSSGSGAMSEDDIRSLQERLVEINMLDTAHEGGTWHWGQIRDDDETDAAIRRFQNANSDEIEALEGANDGVLANDDRNIGSLSGRGVATARARRRSLASVRRHRDGEVRANDPTHQLLANTWPRSIAGVLCQTEEEGYQFLASNVLRRGLPFDDARVNVVGVRGFSGDQTNDNAGARLRTNTHNDTFFVLARDESGNPRVREFPGSVDPGGRTGFEDSPDPDTHVMEADQQLPYWFNTNDRSKMGRTTMTPMTGEGEHGTVVDPNRNPQMTIDPENLNPVRPGGRPGRDLEAMYGQRTGRRTGEEGTMYDNLRTRYGGRPNSFAGKRRGIAIHSSNAGDQLNADSTGCQVVQGDWFGHFTMTIQRGLYWERLRQIAGMDEADRPRAPRNAGQVNQGAFIYSLLNGSDLRNTRPPEAD